MRDFFAHHPDLSVALLLLICAFALFFPYLVQPESLMLPRSGLTTDMLTYNWPSVSFFRQSLNEYGQIPLWQGTSSGGLPTIGNPAIRLFYPPQLLISFLPVPILWGYALLNVFHFWLAGIGGYGLARSVLKLGFPSSIVVALLVMLTPRLSSNVVGDVGYTHGLCWLPLCLLWTRLALDRLSWRWAMAAGLALTAIYLNNIQFILYAGWLVGLYLAYKLICWRVDHQPFAVAFRCLWLTVIILVTFIGLSAFNLFPFVSYLPYQSRQAMTLADANYLALPPVALINTLFPIAQKFPEWEVYSGLISLIFAPLAFRFAPRRELVIWLGLLIFAALFSLGSVTPLYDLMFYGVPGFSLLRVPARMWYVATIALAMLAGLAIDGFFQRRSLSTRAGYWLLGSALLLSLITIMGRFITRRPDELDWMLGIVAALGILFLLVIFKLWQRGRVSARLLSAAFIIAVVVDLFPLDLAFAAPAPISDFINPPPIVQNMIQRAGTDLYRVYSMRREITDSVAAHNQLQTVEGLNSFQFASYSQFVRQAADCQLEGLAAASPPCVSNEIAPDAWRNTRPDPFLLGLLNTRYLITALDTLPDPLFQRVETVGDLYLFENRAFQPRAFLAGRAQQAEGDFLAQLAEIANPNVVLLEANQPVDFVLPDNDFTGVGNILRYTPNEVTIQADMPDAGLLVLGDPWIPGWVAEMEGQTLPVLRVNGALRAVYLTSGSHTVNFVFRPPALLLGLFMSAATAVMCICLILFSRSKKVIG